MTETKRKIAILGGGVGAMAVTDTWLGNPKVGDIHLIAPFAMGIPCLFAGFVLFTRADRLPLWPHRAGASRVDS